MLRNRLLYYWFLFLFLSSCREGYTPPWGDQIAGNTYCQNLLHYTEDFHDEYWFKDEADVQNNVATDPNKHRTADLLDISEDPKESRVYQKVDSVPSGTFVFSVHLRSTPGTKGSFAIGVEFRGQKRIWNKEVVELSDDAWTRASVKIEVPAEGEIVVFPAYALIKGSSLNKVYAWGAQLERITSSDENAGAYCGNEVLLGSTSSEYTFIR
ncbi:phage head spike fiber domain-containing protein [Muriicola marianensis]|nr:hypothetical protein [Muriicola marianensis]